MSVVETVARKLGCAAVLGQEVRSQADLASVVQGRLPLATLNGMSGAGVSSAEIERFIIPEHTRRHRAEKQQPLTVDESDRAVRLLLLQTIAAETFGDSEVAARWLRRPLGELAGAAPLDVDQTQAGARVVETILGKIAWGAAA